MYQSKQAPFTLYWSFGDYCLVGLWAGWLLVPKLNLLLLPAFIQTAFVPRRWTQQKYFTWHAELLPHTEQVVFHKTKTFGNVERHIVDIKNLEKVSPDMVSNPLMWQPNMFDPELVFMDTVTREVFVFDKQGIWNKDALEHPLLY